MRTTMDIYNHVMPALAREAADRMGTVLLAGRVGKLQPETTQAALRKENGLVVGVELRGLEPLTPTQPGRHDRIPSDSLPFSKPTDLRI
jgi:hypothetical protein